MVERRGKEVHREAETKDVWTEEVGSMEDDRRL